MEAEEENLQRERDDVDSESARILRCVEENRKQKLQVMQILQEKNNIISALSADKEELANKVNHLRSVHEQVTRQSRLELLEVQKQIASVEELAKEGKAAQAKFQHCEERLLRQKQFYEEQLQQRDSEMKNLESSLAELQTKVGKPWSGKSDSEALKKIRAEKDVLHAQYRELAARYEEQDKSMQAYCTKLQKLEADLAVSKGRSLMEPSIQAQLLDRQKRETRLLERFQTFEETNSKLQNDLTLQVNENALLKDSVEKLQERLKKTTELLEVCEEEKLKALRKIDILEKERVKIANARTEEIEKLEADAEKERLRLQEELRISRLAAEKLSTECETKNAKILQFKGDSEKMQELAMESKKEVKLHQETSAKLKKEAEALRVVISRCQSDYETMKEDNNTLKEQIIAVRKSEAECQCILAKVNEEVRKKLKFINSETQRTAAQLRISSEKVTTLQDELSHTLGEKEKIKLDLEQKDKENVELVRQIEMLKNHALSLDEKISKMTEAEVKNCNNLQQLESDLMEKCAALAQKEEEIKKVELKYKNNLEEKNDKCADLEKALRSLQVVEERNRVELQTLRENNSALHHQIQQLATWMKLKASGQSTSGGDFSSGDVCTDPNANMQSFSLLLEQLLIIMETKIKSNEERVGTLNAKISQLQNQLNERQQGDKLALETTARDLEKEQSHRRELEERLKNLINEKLELEKCLREILNENKIIQDTNADLEAENFRMRCKYDERLDIFEETEQALETSLQREKRKSSSQKQQIDDLEQTVDGLNAKLLEKDDALSLLKHEQSEQKQILHSLKVREKKRAETQKHLNQIVKEYSLLDSSQDDHEESPMYVLEFLIDKFEGHADHLEYLKLCKTLKNTLIKEKSKVAMANEVVKLVSKTKKK